MSRLADLMRSDRSERMLLSLGKAARAHIRIGQELVGPAVPLAYPLDGLSACLHPHWA